MEYATTSDPAYIIHNQVINTFPESAASNDSRVVGINTDITVADSATSIDNFPDEAEYSVVLYAARNAVERLMNNIQTNSDITTALTATNTELDETQAICDLINTQVDAAVTEIAETVTNIDDNVDTALSAMNTSADKMKAAIDQRAWNEAANQVIDSNYYRQLPNRAGRLVKRLRSLHGSN